MTPEERALAIFENNWFPGLGMTLGTTDADEVINAIAAAIREAETEAVSREREGCAKVAEAYEIPVYISGQGQQSVPIKMTGLAAAIRARGET